jgi:cytochrome c oxidase subunit 2
MFSVWLLMMASGCTGNQSALNPKSLQAGRISNLWWLLFAVLSCIYVAVLLALLIATFRKSGQNPAPLLEPDQKSEKIMQTVVSSAVGVSVLILFIFLFGDLATGRALHELTEQSPFRIKVTGHQWWWEVQYEDPNPSRIVNDANEIHVPVGRTVVFNLQSTDVIHSFWAPNFHGKKDLIPGHPTKTWFRAERAGVFEGQCAEFCGAQHAHMRFLIIAQPEAEFQSWLESQRKPAASPANETEKTGQKVFLSGSCILCHSIDGTSARATVGPNLTHVGSRARLAAGTLPNEAKHLARWILDPQVAKPGVLMPQNTIDAASLATLVAYLESLK